MKDLQSAGSLWLDWWPLKGSSVEFDIIICSFTQHLSGGSHEY